MGSVASCHKLPGSDRAQAEVCVQHLDPAVLDGSGADSSLGQIHRSGKTNSISTALQGGECVNGERGGSGAPKTNSLGRNHCNGGSTLLEDAAAFKLKLLLQQLERGQVPHIGELKKVVNLASEALCSGQEEGTIKSEEERLETVGDRQVREWLSATFTRSDSMYEGHHVSMTPIIKFKAAANTIIISQYFGSMRRDSLPNALQYSPPLTQHLEQVDNWEFDMFSMEKLTDSQPLRYLGHQLLKTHNLFNKCEILVSRFDSFLVKIEEGYNRHGNPYHNAIHGADVAQTLHYMLVATGLKEVMTDLEILGVLLAALIHDVDHPGTTNNFQINQRSEYALLYNDRSVLENHHLYYSFSLMQEGNCNFLSGLSSEDYKLLRGLVVDMVLATDMSSHFDQLKHMRHIMSQPEAGSQLQGVERSKVFSLLLHMCDISHPGKPWALHREWSVRLAEEFYRQGDREKRNALPLSPLCDRNHGNLPTSQIGFIDYIVMPSFELCADVLELLLSTPPASPALTGSVEPSTFSTTTATLVSSTDAEGTVGKRTFPTMPRTVWETHLKHNREGWKREEEGSSKAWGAEVTHHHDSNGTVTKPKGSGISSHGSSNGVAMETSHDPHSNSTVHILNGSTAEETHHHQT